MMPGQSSQHAPPGTTTSPTTGATMHPAFVSAVSHELRSPLSVIVGYGELLRDETLGPLTSDQADAIARICDNAERLLQRIDAILDFSRIQSGRVEVAAHDFAPAEILQSIEAMVKALPLTKSPAVTFAVRQPTSLPLIHADPELTRTALRVLVANALKFTECGTVELSARAADGGVEFIVEDAGPGIPADKLSEIFEPFFKIDESAEKGFRDLGLGLYVARGYAAVQGGTVGVRSELGHGATFRLWLPGAVAADTNG